MRNIFHSRVYTDHIEGLLRQSIDRTPFFVTTCFHDTNISAPFPRQAAYAMQQYERVYRHLTSRLMRNFSKKIYLQPLTFDFLDLPHTRTQKSINLYRTVVPHVHSIYLVHEKTLERFDELQREKFCSINSHPNMRSLQSIHSEAVSYTHLTLPTKA